MTTWDGTRRDFLGAGVVGAAALIAGCGTETEGARAKTAAGGGDDDLGAPSDHDAPGGDALPTCGEHTAPNIEGPFFTHNSPERTALRTAGMPGVALLLEGRVLGPDCQPLAGALLDFWQADTAGAYDNTGYTLRGHQYADAAGRYRLETVVPGHYLNGANYRPAHLHVKVGAAGMLNLTTQLYFENDPYNGIDPFIVESLIMATTDSVAGKRASFDFVMRGVGSAP